MATITVTDSENIVFDVGASTPIIITISETSNIAVEARIDGFIVDQRGIPSATIAVGNIIRGVLNGRYITAEVEALPYTDEDNLDIYIQTIE